MEVGRPLPGAAPQLPAAVERLTAEQLANPSNITEFIAELRENGTGLAAQIHDHFSKPEQAAVLQANPNLAEAVREYQARLQPTQLPPVVVVPPQPSVNPNAYFGDSIIFRSQVEQLFVIGEMCLPVIGALPRVMFAVAKLVVDLTTTVFHSTLSNLSKAFAYCGFVNVAAKFDGGEVDNINDKKMHEVYASARFELLTHDAANLVRGVASMIPVFGQALAIVLHKSDVRFAYEAEETAPNTTRLFDVNDRNQKLVTVKQENIAQYWENECKIVDFQLGYENRLNELARVRANRTDE